MHFRMNNFCEKHYAEILVNFPEILATNSLQETSLGVLRQPETTFSNLDG